MSHNANKKRVSFMDVVQISNIKTNSIVKNHSKKTSILKLKGKKNEELKNDKVMEEIQEKEEEDLGKKFEKEDQINEVKEINIKVPFTSNDRKMKQLPTEEYFKMTIQTELEKGLLNIAMLHPANPIKFLGNYLIEKSKNYSPNV